MTDIYAPTVRARRTLIAVLAFALAAAFAIAASIATAQADDPKVYTAQVGPPPAAVATVNAIDVDPKTTVTFTNVLPTTTQQAGSFSVAFPAGLTVDSADKPVASGGQDWNVLSTSGNTVVISAFDGGHRIGVLESVSVVVHFDNPQTGNYPLTTLGDQQAGGEFEGGNLFTLDPPEPTIIVEAACTAEQGGAQGEGCRVTAQGNSGDSGTSACAPLEAGGCGKAGTISVEFDGADPEFEGSAIWIADTGTGTAAQNFFYLIIDTGGVKNPTILADQVFVFDNSGNLVDSSGLAPAKNCQPPKRIFGCVDIKHPDYSKKLGIYAIRFPAGDPRGGYR